MNAQMSVTSLQGEEYRPNHSVSPKDKLRQKSGQNTQRHCKLDFNGKQTCGKAACWTWKPKVDEVFGLHSTWSTSVGRLGLHKPKTLSTYLLVCAVTVYKLMI